MADIIVTGAGRGIGYFMTEQFLEDGNRVAVLDTETDGLEKLARRFPGRLVFYRTDVREEKQIQSAVDAAVETFGKVDAAVHNACCCPFVWEKDAALSVYEKAFDVNYYGALRLAKCVLPHMRARKGGRVIFTSSGVGVTGFAGISAYASTKGALESLFTYSILRLRGRSLPHPFRCRKNLWQIRKKWGEGWQRMPFPDGLLSATAWYRNFR